MASSKGCGCGALLAVLLVVGGVGAAFNAVTGKGDADDAPSATSNTASAAGASKSPDVGDSLGAQTVCETFAQRRLKAPSTADFSEAKVTHQNGGLWRVAGTVDAENSLGAKLRDYYTCRVLFQHDETYKLVSLTGLD